MTQESLAKEYYYECRAQGMKLPRIAEMLNISEEELMRYIRSDSKPDETVTNMTPSDYYSKNGS